MEDLVYYYFAFFLALLLTFKHIFHRNQKLPPSPLARPIIGHLHLIKNRPHEALQNLASKYGPVLFLRLGSRPTVVVSSPSAAEECFTKNDIVFSNRPRTLAGDCLTYDYTSLIWAPYGHLWRILRRLAVVELFSSRSLQRSAVVRDEETRDLLSHLFRLRKVKLDYWFSLLTFNSMMRIVAGKRCVDGDGAETEKGEKIVEELKATFLAASPLNYSDYFPILRWMDYGGMKKSLMGVHRKRDAFLQGLIDEFRRKKAVDSEDKHKSTLIGTLLRLQESDPEFYSDDSIKSTIQVMFIGGTGTSSATMERATTLLLNHPEALRKVRAEIDSQVGRSRLIQDSDLPNLVYLHFVVAETLRLHPPAPLLLPRYSSEACTIGGFEVPGGTTLLVNVWAMHRDPKVWEAAGEFRPERFDASPVEREGFKFMPFGMGRRACPGNTMGMRAVSLAVGALVQCFHLERESLGSETDCIPRENALALISQL